MSLKFKIGLFLYNFIYNFLEFLFFFTSYWWWKFTVLRTFHYFDKNSYRIMKSEKSAVTGLSERTFTYGETGALTTKLILQEINPKKNALLYDLGCGRGSFLFAANFIFDLRGVGIEIFTPYTEIGRKLRKSLKTAGVSFRNENIADSEISDADIVFCAGTTFDKPLIDTIVGKLKDLKMGAIVIFVHNQIKDEDFILINEGSFPFSWGTDKVYFYRKK
ncbi:MAG: methyltransferase domain-containing protein [Firmicutes bacterium]|nr:methyltransferase domain-containing protein [Bacillota bacterium]